MSSFTMNSLVGTDDAGNDIVSLNDQWYVLNEILYRQVLEELRADSFHELLRLIRISRQVALGDGDATMHYCDGSPPFLLLESQTAIRSLHGDYASRPGIILRQDYDDSALCHRQRTPIRAHDGYCLFPLIVSSRPPESIMGTKLLSHELVHLRHTLSERYGQAAIRESYWNMDLMAHIGKDFPDFSKRVIRSYLEEEWEACGENFRGDSRQDAFSKVYIPVALDKIATLLDLWLCDMGKYLNFGRYADAVTAELRSVLEQLGYDDLAAVHPMDPRRWERVASVTLRQAHALWKQRHGSFLACHKEALES